MSPDLPYVGPPPPLTPAASWEDWRVLYGCGHWTPAQVPPLTGSPLPTGARVVCPTCERGTRVTDTYQVPAGRASAHVQE